MRRKAAPVQVEGCDLSVVSLQVHKVEDVLGSLLVSLLPDVRARTHERARVITDHQDIVESEDTSHCPSPHGLKHDFSVVLHLESQFQVMPAGLHHCSRATRSNELLFVM